MDFWQKAKRTSIKTRQVEERRYAQVLKELESGIRRDGLWAKAIQQSRGNDQFTTSLYIKLRVQSLRDEAEVVLACPSDMNANFGFRREPSDDRSTQEPINLRDHNGKTALMRAVERTDLKSVKGLLQGGSDPWIKEGRLNASTALDVAKSRIHQMPSAREKAVLDEIISVLEKAMRR